MGSPDWNDPLWGEEDWGGSVGSSTPFTFPPADPDAERGNLDITQVRASVKSGGKSQDDSQLITTIGPPEARVVGTGGMWDEKGNWVPTGVPGPTVAPGTTHTEVLTDHLGNPVTTSTGDWVYVTGVPN